jgi:hypothetical protein
MSSVPVFELEIIIDLEGFERKLNEIWTRDGYSVDLLKYPEFGECRIFCFFNYFFHKYPENERYLREIISYLLEVKSSENLYYYRCDDFVPIGDYDTPILAISIDDIFTEEFCPSLGASLEVKYLIKEPGK